MNNVAPREFIFFLLRDQLNAFSENANIVKNAYPFEILLNSKRLSIFVNETHDSGRGRPNEDECRIQINREQWEIAQQNSSVFLGYNPDQHVFSIWDPQLINGRVDPTTFSIYSRFSKLVEASERGYSAYGFRSQILRRNSFCLNFHPKNVGMVLDNIDTIWSSGSLNPDRIFGGADDSQEVPLPHTDETVERDKERVSVTTKRYKRDSRFKVNVLAAYENRCAVCAIQMGIIEAAHIVPHSHKEGTDLVQNGIALCPNHHRMFDSGLVGLTKSFRISINWKRVDYLRQLELSAGVDELTRIDDVKVLLPKAKDLMPSAINIEISNKIRGIDWD